MQTTVGIKENYYLSHDLTKQQKNRNPSFNSALHITSTML